MFNSSEIRSQFPALGQKVNGHDLVYLDSAATTLKPNVVIDRITNFYKFETANVHRGAHYLSDKGTVEFENGREAIRKLFNAASTEEIIFTKGTTEGLNLLASSYGETFLNEGDEIVLTELEHHANIVPWQILALKKKCVVKYIAVNETGELEASSIDQVITTKTKIVSFSGCSNILGTITDVEKIVAKAKSVGAITILDAAQLISQKKIDVQKLDVDFLVLSSHKLFGPFGFGALYGKKSLLSTMPPYQTGGSMISSVGFDKTTFNDLPFKFEAGTPHVEGAVGTAAAIQFFTKLNIEDVFAHEQKLMNQLTEGLLSIPEIKLFGTAKNKAAIVSFNLQGAHHSDIGQILDQMGVAVRVGHHCTQPLLKKFGLTGTVRASISLYNNETDIEKTVEAVKKARRMLL
ncbi:MAG: SufS family cysteine desulfurase [Bdellovibrio sp.]|nr:SufS family cysteine desulfurase [Bdellovibrio sp.]